MNFENRSRTKRVEWYPKTGRQAVSRRESVLARASSNTPRASGAESDDMVNMGIERKEKFSAGTGTITLRKENLLAGNSSG